MNRVSRAEFQRIKRKQEDRQKRTEENAKFIRRMKRLNGQPIALSQDKTAVKKDIVHLLGLLDAKVNGPQCRIIPFCPKFKKIGTHNGECGYHIVPAKRGGEAVLHRKAVVWACHDANFGECNNRDLYEDYHIALFGKERVEELKAMARKKKDWPLHELLDLRRQIKAELEAN